MVPMKTVGSPLSTSSGWGPQAQKTEVANVEAHFAVQCMVLAFSLWLAANVSHMVGLLLWGCTEPGMALCQEEAKHQYLVFVDAVGVGYCTDMAYVNEMIEHSPCSFSLLG